MPLQHDWQTRIKSVEREMTAMKLAVERLIEIARSDSTILKDKLRHQEIVHSAAKLEPTYIIRLFAEFEAGVRQFWRTIRRSTPQTRNLIDGLASQRRVPAVQLENCHIVRRYRNFLVHEQGSEIAPISMGTARSHLCHFFSFLPQKW